MKGKKLIMRTGIIFLALVLLAMPFTAGCAKPSPVISEWNIPNITVLSGPGAAMGLEGNWIIEFTAKQINDAGGINGLPIKLTKYDSKFDPAVAVECMSRAVSDGLIVIGPGASTEVEASGDIAVSEGVFFISPSSDPASLRRFEPWCTSLYPPYTPVTKAVVAKWLNENPDVKSVVIFYQPVFLTSVVEMNAATEVLEAAGVEVFPPIESPPGVLDVGPQVTKALSYNPDGFFVSLFPDISAQVIIELRKRGLTEGRRIQCGQGGCIPVFFEMGKGYLEDVYTFDFMNPYHEGAKWQTLVTAYRAEHPGIEYPFYGAVIYYDAVYLVKQAIEVCEITGDPAKLAEERIKIRDYINGLGDFDGIMGKYNIVNCASTAPIYYFQVHNDKRVLISSLDWQEYQ